MIESYIGLLVYRKLYVYVISMTGVTHLTIGWTGVKQDIKQSTVCELSQPFYTSQGDGVKSSTEKQKNNINCTVKYM